MSATSNATTRHPDQPSGGKTSACADTPSCYAAPQPGDRVQIFQIKAFYRPFIEGPAIPGAPGVYDVRFEGESRLQRRQVLPDIFQSSPELALEVLQTAWRAGLLINHAPHLLACTEFANDNSKEA